MAFLDIKSSSIYLSITNQPKLIRPLMVKPESRWVTMIPSCTIVNNNKKETLRKFRSVESSFSNWMRNNPDPLWDQLDQDTKFDRSGNRIDFPTRPQHIMVVWSYSDTDIQVIKQGNQFYEEMEKWADSGGNVIDCDFLVWTVGEGRRKTYKTQRQDSTEFNPGVDVNLLPKIQASLETAISDLVPFKDEEELLKFIHGQTDAEAEAFPFGANAQQGQLPASSGQPQQHTVQSNIPAYVPGGQSVVGLVSNPLFQQTQVPQQQVPQAPQQQVPQAPQQQVPQAPQQQIPQQQIPQQQIPQQQVPQQQAPQQQIPQQQVPQQQAPQQQVPQQQVPQQQIPQQQIPQQQIPQQQIPQQQVPQQQVPQQQQDEVPNAPVSSLPIFAPSTNAVSSQPDEIGDPAEYVVDFGKFSGKTLGWISENEPKYLNFLRNNKKELSSLIDKLPVPPQPEPQSDEINRDQLIKECNLGLQQLFVGGDIVSKMMPFLEKTIGTHNFSEAPTEKLITLRQAIDQYPKA